MKKIVPVILFVLAACYACAKHPAGSSAKAPAIVTQARANPGIHHVKITMPVYPFNTWLLEEKLSKFDTGTPIVIEYNDTNPDYNITVSTLHYDYYGHMCDTLDKSMEGVCHLGKTLCYIKGKNTLDQLFAIQTGTDTIEFDTDDNMCKCMEDIWHLTFKVKNGPWSPPKPIVNEGAFRHADQMPEFPGGNEALKEYIQSHIIRTNGDDGSTGKVIVQFVVKKDGTIGEVKVARSLNKELDKEAVRIIKSLPRFTPGRNGGEPVDVWYFAPVSFKLEQLK